MAAPAEPGPTGSAGVNGPPEPRLQVAHTAEAFNVGISPHFLMELHVSLAAAVPNGMYVEHIPQLGAITRSRLSIAGGQVSPAANHDSCSVGHFIRDVVDLVE